jgi:hypothetical protein
MPSVVENPFVAFLGRYTTASPDHEAAFDEFLAKTPPPSGQPLRLPTRVEAFLRERFDRPDPPSVILTGNAGDGKTFLCRQILAAFGVNDPDWDALATTPLERDGVRLRVVKDLSELSRPDGARVLGQLAEALEHPGPERLLIAANEGRLRDLLGLDPTLAPLLSRIEAQLRDGPDAASADLVVINLTAVATSAFVPAALAWMADAEHWRACAGCPLSDNCPIRWSANRLRDPHVVGRVQLLYRLLEQLDVHVTVRDMLIHLAYTLAGNLRCRALQQAHNRHESLAPFVYYNNVWGRDDDPAFQRKAAVVQQLARLRVGEHSLFEIDDFIVSGDAPEHAALFAPAVDLNGRRFDQDRAAYLSGAADRSAAEEEAAMMGWLRHCRRKLFFEWREVRQTNRLIPFLYLDQYFALLHDERGARDQRLGELIQGLNHAFSRLFLADNSHLYVTTQYLHSGEQPRPLVRLRFPRSDLWLKLRDRSSQAFDCDLPALELVVAPPAQLRSRDDVTVAPVRWRIGLLAFEYLLRLAHGGTYNILAEECELGVRSLKDQLLRAFASPADDGAQLEFFVAERHRYSLRSLRIDEQGQIRGNP